MNRLLSALLALCVVQQPAPQKAPAAPEPKASPEELLKTADDLVKQTAALRQLTVKSPVKRGVLGRDAIRAKLRDQIARQYTSKDIDTEARVLKALGLLPKELDFEKLQLDLLMEQVGGFYDPWGKQLYIADWLPLEMQAPALAHEIVHALQDQHFNLQKFVQAVHDQGDRQLARGALVEGDATGVMLEFSAHKDLSTMPDMSKMMDMMMATGAFSLGGQPMPVLQSAPAFVKHSLMFPYVGGLGFIQYIRKRYPWSKVDEVYKHPPDSTEQIMHPDKYFAKEQPVWLKATPLSAFKGKKPVHEDTVGELQIKLWLQYVGGAKNAGDAAAGWGGDRLLAYDNGDGPYTVVWLTQWDTEADATEFANAAKATVDKLGAWMTPPKGNQVVIEINVPAESRQKIADEVFKSWKPGHAPEK
jgi:hypothetical protein